MSGKIEVLNETYEFEGKNYKGALFKVIIPISIKNQEEIV